jgi:hypothetical protein
MNTLRGRDNVSGGTAALRGYEFQAYSIVFYTLLRFEQDPDLRLHVETVQDAVLEYSASESVGLRELLQCKKTEQGGRRDVGRGYGNDRVSVGRFSLADLRNWLDNEADQSSVRKLLGSPNTVLTALLFGSASSELLKFAPWKPTRPTDANLWERPDFVELFPASFRHPPKQIAELAPSIAAPNVRQKLRVLMLPTWAELRRACEMLIREKFRIPTANIEPAVLKLLDEYGKRSLARDPAQRVLSGTEIAHILDDYRADRALWIDAAQWLRRGVDRPHPHLPGEPLDWADFESGHYVERPEFGAAEQALKEGGFVVFHGHAGGGKTSLARFLGYRLLSQDPSVRGFVLRVKPGFKLQGEEHFLDAHLESPAVFFIEDSHFSLDEVVDLLMVFHAAQMSGRVKAKMIVTTTERYGPRQLASRDKRNDPQSYAAAFRLEPLSETELTVFIERYASHRKVSLLLPAATISALAGGRVALALIIVRAIQEVTPPTSVQRALSERTLGDLLTDWIAGKTGVVDRKRFEQLLVPIFHLTTFWIRPAGRFAEGVAILEQAGMRSLEPDVADYALSYLVSNHHRANLVQSFKAQIEDDWTSIVPVLQRLSREPAGRLGLNELLRDTMPYITATIADESLNMPLGDIAAILHAAYRAKRAGDLFGALAAPGGDRSLEFWNRYCSLERMRTAASIGAFFGALFLANRYLLRRLANGDHALHERHNQLVTNVLLQSPTLHHIAVALRALYRCSREFARAITEGLARSAIFQDRMRTARQNVAALPDLTRYCSLLYTFDREQIGRLLDAACTAPRLTSFFLAAANRTGALVALNQLSDARPRVVRDALRQIWDADRDTLVEHCTNQTDFVAFTKPIYLVGLLNRRVARNLAEATEVHAANLVAKLTDYEDAASELEMLQRSIGNPYARRLIESLNEKAILESLANTSHRFGHAGRALATFASLHPEFASRLEERLNFETLARRVVRNPLFNLSHLIHGFLSAVPWDISHDRIAQYCQTTFVRTEFSRAWAGNQSLSQATACLCLLTRSSFSPDHIRTLLGFDTWAQFDDDVSRRLLTEHALGQLSACMYQLALIRPSVAEDVLSAYVAKAHTPAAVTPQQTAGKRFQQVQRHQMGPYKSTLRDLVGVGTMLQVAAMINSRLAATLAEGVKLEDLDRVAREEMNLGRLSVLLVGLADSSRQKALELVSRMSTDDVRSAQLEENENIRNVWHFARTLTRISKAAGGDYVSFVSRQIGRDIAEFAQTEANLMEISNWLRMIAGEPSRARLVTELIPCLDEAMEYDSQVRHLIEAATALAECGHIQDGRRFADAAVNESRQLRNMLQLRDFVDIVLKAAWLERRLGHPGFTDKLFSRFDASQLARMCELQATDKSRSGRILLAFAIHLLGEDQPVGLDRFVGVARTARAGLLDEVSSLQPLETTLILSLCGGRSALLQDAAANPNWTALGERGLAHMIATATTAGVSRLLATPFATECTTWISQPPFELSPHASNLQFALAFRLVEAAGGPPELVNRIGKEAAGRATDEASGATRWMLSDVGRTFDAPPYWYIWNTLRLTVLRRTYLAWEDSITSAAADEATGGAPRLPDLIALSS